MGRCKIDNCYDKKFARGYCRKHYDKHKWKTFAPIPIPTARERFFESYTPEPNTGCWLWTKSVDNGGYGGISINGKDFLAHRFSWFLHNGAIPKKLWVLHTCDMPSCVNPDHLYLGTHQDNMDDMVKRGRSTKGRKRNVRKRM